MLDGVRSRFSDDLIDSRRIDRFSPYTQIAIPHAPKDYLSKRIQVLRKNKLTKTKPNPPNLVSSVRQ